MTDTGAEKKLIGTARVAEIETPLEEHTKKLIGSDYCKAHLDPRLLVSQGQPLTPYERNRLWEIFQQIGLCWKNLYYKNKDSSNLKSSWLEFIEAKTSNDPSYAGEYSNAVLVVDELIEMYGKEKAYQHLFLRNGIPDGPPTTRLAHAKRYVIDEFIRVNIIASGFKSFGGKNYKGYVGGSRYNIRARVRDYKPKGGK